MRSSFKELPRYGSIPTVRTVAEQEESIESNHHDEGAILRNLRPCAILSLGVTIMFVLAALLPSNPSPAMLSTMGISNREHKSSHKKDTKQRKPMPHYYKHQTVDHFDKHDERVFSNRYFVNDDFFEGPGSPIFVVLGGEDALDGLLYPFVWDRLAKRFGAMTLGIEHRFFGTSQPIRHPTKKELRDLMTPHQAILDVVELVQWKQRKLGCSEHRSSKHYCPVITVGGSYPGFMSAVLRTNYPDVIDIGYAASAPLKLYSHTVSKDAYFDKVTAVAEEAVPGCSEAMRSALYQVHNELTSNTENKDVKTYAKKLGICHKAIPRYILEADDPVAMLLRETSAIIAGHVAEADMDYYPPRNDTELAQACHIFTNPHDDSIAKVAKFLNMRQDWWDIGCFDMHSELPSGKHATISSTDWSGMGDGETATMWELLSCQLLPQCSIGADSMFFPREWTFDFVKERCETRFGLTPDMDGLVNDLGFDDLTNVTHLLFTNGLHDGWEVASVMEGSPDGGVVVINMANGAHHSDLMHGPSQDTADIMEAHDEIEFLLDAWLSEVAKSD